MRISRETLDLLGVLERRPARVRSVGCRGVYTLEVWNGYRWHLARILWP
jgi:hypothetical protein